MQYKLYSSSTILTKKPIQKNLYHNVENMLINYCNPCKVNFSRYLSSKFQKTLKFCAYNYITVNFAKWYHDNYFQYHVCTTKLLSGKTVTVYMQMTTHGKTFAVAQHFEYLNYRVNAMLSHIVWNQ